MRACVPKKEGLFLPVSMQEFHLADTLDCGQSFRFQPDGCGGMRGIAGNRILHAVQSEEGILFRGMRLSEFDAFWNDYFDLSMDYSVIKQAFSEDPSLRKAIRRAGGIRILRQERFEMLISFLISQNNNIPRIKSGIERLCQKFGDPVSSGRYAFPTAERLAGCALAEFGDLGLGYRDKYILDCARRVADGRLPLDAISAMGLEQARETLRTVQGIGPKVAECVLLFGFHRLDAFPVDTWMKKVLSAYYPNGFPEKFAPVAGVAQQYLFHAMRLGGTLDAS